MEYDLVKDSTPWKANKIVHNQKLRKSAGRIQWDGGVDGRMDETKKNKIK